MKHLKYNKNLEYTYAFGVTPVIDLLKTLPKAAIKIYLSKRLEQKLADEIILLCRKNIIPFEFNSVMFEKLAFKDNTYAIAVFQKYTTELDNRDHIVLVNPSNMGNLGTILRTMAAFSVNNLAIIKPAADIFDPKVVSSSMGAFFHINFKYYDSIEDYLETYKSRNLYSFMLSANASLIDVKFISPYSLIFGNEGQGLPSKYSEFSNTLKIEHSSAVDSLNLAVAVGIALYST